MGQALYSQTATGNIIGRITDSTGAVIGGAAVTALNPDKGLTFRTVTDSEGIYRFFYLAPAVYTLSVQHAGFSSVERPGVQLQSNETPTVDIQLTVGNVVQKLEVTSASPLVEAATSTSGTQLAGKEMNSLPIMQRYTWMAMYLMPDVTSMNGFHMDGQRDRGLGYTLDGVVGTQPVVGGEATNTTLSTTANAIQEVKMASTVLPAEFGHSAGGLFSATYKSGANRFHWEGEDRYTDNAMYHRPYFGLTNNPPFSYHELASLSSGPVFIPKVYNGKNKTFFLFGWSMHRERYNSSVFTTVPTPAELNGDFTFGGIGYPIYDPASTKLANALWSSTPFPGNIIPKNRFDPAVVKFLSNTPWDTPNQANVPLTAAGPVANNYADTSTYYSYRYRYDAKVDHNFSDKNRIFGRYSQVINRAVGDQIGINWRILDGSAVLQPVDQEQAVISDTEVFSPTLLNEVRLGFNRWHLSRSPPGLNANWAQQLGIPNVPGTTFPTFDNSTGGNFWTTAFPGGVLSQMSQSYVLQDNVTKIVGKHSFRMGWELLRSEADVSPQAQPGGIFNFGGTYAPLNPAVPNGTAGITPNTGNDFAAFLLGSVTKATFSTNLANWLPRWWSNAVYFQDDWSVNRRLTLNVGLRWSYETPFQTKYGQQSEFNPTVTDPLTGYMGAITHPSGPLQNSDYKHFQPRFGGAYKIRDNMVFRGGFGLTTIDLFSPNLGQNFQEYASNVTVQQPSGNPSPAFFLSQGPGALNFNVLSNGTSPFVGANCGPGVITGCGSRSAERIDPNLSNAYAMNWNATYQWEFLPDWMLELNYVGSAGVGLLEGWNINTIPLGNSAAYSNQQPNLPFPNFGTITQWGNFGHSTYHAGSVKVLKRFSHGFTLTSFYTKSKALDECDNDTTCSGETFYNRSLEKGRANFDIANRAVAYATYALPVGKGRKFMNRGGVLDYIFGGWNVTWIQTFQSGLPVMFTLAGSTNTYLPGNGVQRPDQVGPNSSVLVSNWTIGNRFPLGAANPLWNLSSFVNPAAFTAGTVGRDTINGPHLVWSQASASKEIHIREFATLQLRYDVNNVFKNPNFTNPNSVVNLSSPGVFARVTGVTGGFCCLGGMFIGDFVVKLTF
jgi:hypothetical protein